MSGEAPGALLILGAGGHGRAVADLALDCGFTVAGFTDPRGRAAGPNVIGADDDLPSLVGRLRPAGAVVGLGDTALIRRSDLFQRIARAGLTPTTLVHPRAVVSRSSSVGAGTAVFGGCALGAGVRVGHNAVLYSAVVAEHDCLIADHAYLGPGVILSGAVTVESGAFLGAGAVVGPGVKIGARAVVAAGAVVMADVAPGTTVIGVPARPKTSSS